MGLSQTTVSRALNGYPEVKETTRKRVQDEAARLNYAPNNGARVLATGRSMSIGHVIPQSTQHEMVNPIFGDFVAGAAQTYSKRGYDMVLKHVEDGEETEVYRKLIHQRRVDGVIVHGPKRNDPRIQLLNELKFPFVVHGRSSESTETYSWIDVNNFRSFQRATDFLLDLGHTSVALINGLEDMDFALRRRNGYLSALGQRHVQIDKALMASAEMTEANGYRAASVMLARNIPPTAFLVSSIISGMGVRRAIEETGRQMGRDVSVIIHDDCISYLTESVEEPTFTATRSSVREAGRISAELLMTLVEGDATTPQSRLLETQLVVGRSTGPAPR